MAPHHKSLSERNLQRRANLDLRKSQSENIMMEFSKKNKKTTKTNTTQRNKSKYKEIYITTCSLTRLILPNLPSMTVSRASAKGLKEDTHAKEIFKKEHLKRCEIIHGASIQMGLTFSTFKCASVKMSFAKHPFVC